MTTEYPALPRRRPARPVRDLAARPARAAGARRAAPARTSRAACSACLPLAIYNQSAFGSFTHVAYDDIPRQQHGFFGIHFPSLHVLATLLLSSRGLLTISPVLVMAGIGIALMYRRGRRAEALTIAAICICYLIYNAGYYLPFGGGFSGPRFLMAPLPFLALGLAYALSALPGADGRARRGLGHDDDRRHRHSPADRLRNRGLQVGAATCSKATSSRRSRRPTGSGAAGTGSGPSYCPRSPRSCSGSAASARVREALRRASGRAVLAALGALLAWLAFATLAPTVLGIDHRGLVDIAESRRSRPRCTRASATIRCRVLAPLAFAAGLLALLLPRLWTALTRRRHAIAAGATLPA